MRSRVRPIRTVEGELSLARARIGVTKIRPIWCATLFAVLADAAPTSRATRIEPALGLLMLGVNSSTYGSVPIGPSRSGSGVRLSDARPITTNKHGCGDRTMRAWLSHRHA
jgi:hypothetical protein